MKIALKFTGQGSIVCAGEEECCNLRIKYDRLGKINAPICRRGICELAAGCTSNYRDYVIPIVALSRNILNIYVRCYVNSI